MGSLVHLFKVLREEDEAAVKVAVADVSTRDVSIAEAKEMVFHFQIRLGAIARSEREEDTMLTRGADRRSRSLSDLLASPRTVVAT